MIVFSCSECSKKLQVQDAFAGKVAKCPNCGQAVLVPAGAGVSVTAPPSSVAAGGADALPPKPLLDETVGDVSAPSSPNGETLSPYAPAAADPEQYDFLAPSQNPGELGRLGTYRVLKVLGVGGMGVVFQAEDPQLERAVALKAMKPALAASASAKKRFQREAKTTAKIKHDHIVAIYQVGEDRGVPFLAMEFLEGESLDERIKHEVRLPLPEVLRIGREMAEGLAAAHEHKLIHRDIKPGNVWLEGKRGRVKILDFGLARAADDDTHLTQSGAIVGTPAYMAPEQAQAKPVDARTDLFSLGCVLYRMSTGELPFKGKDAMSMVLALATQEPQLPHEINGDVPMELSRLIMQLLAKNAADRPASARAVVDALQEIEAGQTVLMTPPAPPPQAPRAKRQAGRRWPLVAAGLVFLMLLLAGGTAAVIHIKTSQGDYVIETDDPDYAFSVNKDGSVALTDLKTERKYVLKVLRQANGESELEVTDVMGDLKFTAKTFTIKKGEKATLTAWLERKPAPGGAVDDAWLKSVAAMKPEEQVAAVAKKLQELNPGFDGKATHKIENDVVTQFVFCSDNVTDIAAVRALKGLTLFNCEGSANGRGKLSDLTPLKGLKLVELSLNKTKVSDLSPLKDMQLKYLYFNSTQVSDLTSLRDMKPTQLDCSFSPVSDLSPLKDMKLTWLNCCNTKVSNLTALKDMKLARLLCNVTAVQDLSPLKDMKLTYLECGSTTVSDLSPLKGMPLTFLNCMNTQVSDLSPLRGMPLEGLSFINSPVSDLTPLKAMKLQNLWIDLRPGQDTEWLRAKKTLETINYKAVAEFWKEFDAKRAEFDAWLKSVATMKPEEQVEAVAKKLKELNPEFDGKVMRKRIEGEVVTELKFSTDGVADIAPVRALVGLRLLECSANWPGDKCRLTDLSPIKGMKVTHLFCADTQVADLTPLKDMKLTNLDLRGTKVKDLSPLRGMPLVAVSCGGNMSISDLSPLKDMKLTFLDCQGSNVSDLTPLRDMKLTSLACGFSAVTDLTPVSGQPISTLAVNVRVTDLAPLKGMPLQHLWIDLKPGQDTEWLRAKKTLETINNKPAAEFWKEFDAKRAEFDAWLKSVAVLKPEEQVAAVAKKLQELNPEFDGKVTHLIERNVVTKLSFVSDNITDISPVRALTGLTVLNCGSDAGKSRLTDLSPVSYLKLDSLYCNGTAVTDLTPLKNTKISGLQCAGTLVNDLAPLTGLPLGWLNCRDTKIKDLKPLQGQTLLFQLDCCDTQVTDLTPLHNMKLKSLLLDRTPVADLMPVKGQPLEVLAISGTRVKDLSPLKDMPLKTIWCDFKRDRDTEVLHSIKTLEKINDKPAAEFWKEVDAKK